MKLPFASCIGANLKRYRRFYCKFCSACGLGQWWFVICLGFLGAVVAITDIMDLLHCSQRPLLSETIWRTRLHRGSERLVSPEAERDMKLMVTILSVEHYLLMIFGVIQDLDKVIIAINTFNDSCKSYLCGIMGKLTLVFMEYIVALTGVFFVHCLQTNPALLMPWLMMEAVVIALEAIFFGMRLFVEGLAINRNECIMSAIVIHNWFQVFCFFRKYISLCDL